jgi:hypothetical protein
VSGTRGISRLMYNLMFLSNREGPRTARPISDRAYLCPVTSADTAGPRVSSSRRTLATNSTASHCSCEVHATSSWVWLLLATRGAASTSRGVARASRAATITGRGFVPASTRVSGAALTVVEIGTAVGVGVVVGAVTEQRVVSLGSVRWEV